MHLILVMRNGTTTYVIFDGKPVASFSDSGIHTYGPHLKMPENVVPSLPTNDNNGTTPRFVRDLIQNSIELLSVIP